MRAWKVLTLALALAACVEPAPEDLLVGQYDLLSIDGHSVPFRIVLVPGIEIIQRTLTLAADGSFDDLIVLRVKEGRDTYHVPLDLVGMYQGGEPVVSFIYESGRQSDALFDGRELELDDRGVTFVFRR